MSTDEQSFWEAVDRIRAAEPRYRREAYAFVLAALGVTVDALPEERRADPNRRHLSGPELVAGAVTLARHEFGVLAATVFKEWGIGSSEDIGAIVFQLVEAGQLSARPEDRREDFAGGPDLEAALTQGLELGGARWNQPGPESQSSRRPKSPE